MPAAPEMKALIHDVHGRIKDLLEPDQTKATMALALLIVELGNKSFPRSFTDEEKLLIKQNCPNVTEDDLSSRSLSDKGLKSALSLFQMVSGMIIDYSPSTNVQDEITQDTSDPKRQVKAQAIAEKAFADLKSLGYTSFGAMATLSSVSTGMSIEDGCPALKLVRVLNDLAMDCTRR